MGRPPQRLSSAVPREDSRELVTGPESFPGLLRAPGELSRKLLRAAQVSESAREILRVAKVLKAPDSN